MGEILTPAFLMNAGNKLLKIAVIIVIAIFVLRFFNVVVERVFAPKAGKKFYIEEKRAITLSALLKTILRYTIYFIAAVMTLQEFQIDTTSIIAGAGIIGLAVGVGAQGLVKDVITGFFIIFEDQYAVGDYVVSGDMSGTVEEVGFRVTKLRDANGVLHIIPNGAISRISNYTRGNMQAAVTIPVAYEADIQKVLALIEQACMETGREMPEVINGPQIVGIVDLRPGELIIKVIAKTVPLEQVKVEAALRLKIMILFEAARIPMPMPLVPPPQKIGERRERQEEKNDSPL